jgi:hypothetical protein
LATTLLGGRSAVGSSSADKGVDSFIDFGFSECILAFFGGGTSSSSSELFKENMDCYKYNDYQEIWDIKYEKLTKETSNHILRQKVLMIFLVPGELKLREKAWEKDLH